MRANESGSQLTLPVRPGDRLAALLVGAAIETTGMSTSPPLCPTCGQPASEALGGPAHDWECRNEACSEFGQPVRWDEPLASGWGLRERLDAGVVVGAEGYLFELERRGYLKAGPFVPEVVLDFPDAVRELHREMLRAGADVMVAFTYYGHRDKLRSIGREDDLEPLNRHALRLAREVAAEGDALVAGNICNTWVYDLDAPERSGETVREMYREQVRWAAEEGADLVISETHDYLGEALISVEAIQEAGLPSVVTFASTERADDRRVRVRRRVPAAGGRGRRRRRAQLLARSGDDAAAARADQGRGRLPRRRAAGAVPDDAGAAELRGLKDADGVRGFPIALEPFLCNRFELADFAGVGARPRRALHRHLLRRRAALRPRDGRAAGPHGAREPLLARHGAAPDPRRERRRAREAVRELEGLSAAA